MLCVCRDELEKTKGKGEIKEEKRDCSKTREKKITTRESSKNEKKNAMDLPQPAREQMVHKENILDPQIAAK